MTLPARLDWQLVYSKRQSASGNYAQTFPRHQDSSMVWCEGLLCNPDFVCLAARDIFRATAPIGFYAKRAA